MIFCPQWSPLFSFGKYLVLFFFFQSSSARHICSFLYLLRALRQLCLLGVEVVSLLVQETCLGPTRPSTQSLGGQRSSALRAGWLPVDHPLLDTLWLPNCAWKLQGDAPTGTGPNCAVTGSLQQLNSRDDPSFQDSGLLPGTGYLNDIDTDREYTCFFVGPLTLWVLETDFNCWNYEEYLFSQF